jgi:putative transposase
VTPVAKRAAVRWVRERYRVSERRACALVGLDRATARYRARPRDDETSVRQRLRELAAERPRFGYRRLHVLLRREGVRVNYKRVARLYREEGLAVRRRSRKRAARGDRGRPAAPTRPAQQWGLDFVSDALTDGRRLRLLGVLDLFTREALAIEVACSLPGEQVVAVLERLASERPLPEEIVLDNGPELAGKALDQWAAEREVRLRFIDPGKPVQNAFVESFNGRLRDECLDQHWFHSLADAQRTVEAWRVDYNQQRPHSALGYRAPEAYRQAFEQTTTTTTTTIKKEDGLS